MDSDLIIGLRISVIGFGVTFLALCLLILVILFLLRFFPDKTASGQELSEESQTDPQDLDEQRLEELAVALAVSICLLEHSDALAHHDPSLGKLLER